MRIAETQDPRHGRCVRRCIFLARCWYDEVMNSVVQAETVDEDGEEIDRLIQYVTDITAVEKERWLRWFS